MRFILGLSLVGCLVGLPEISFSKETAKVLPGGIYRARVVGVVTSEVKDTYNDSGDIQSLTYGLNRTVTIGDLAAGASGSDKTKLETLISSLDKLQPGLGASLAGSSSNLYSDMSVKQQVSLFALEKGITSHISLGIRAPIVKRTVRHRFHVNSVDNSSPIAKSLGGLAPPDVAAGLENLSQLDTGFYENALFASKGYVVPQDFQKTQLGDTEFGGKWNFYDTDLLASTVLLGMGAPTGAKSDLRNPFDKGNSKETWCYAVQVFQEVYPLKGVTLGGAAKYGMSFKDTRDRAVPKDENDSLPSLLPEAGQVQSVSRQRGAQLETELSAGYRFDREKFGVWTAYQYSAKDKDKFSGPGNLYYEGLAKGTDYAVHAGEVGVEVSMVRSYLRKTFPIPMEVSFLYNKTLQGKNTPLASYGRMDLMVYF